MNETIEERLKRVLTESAVREVPDTMPVPPRRVARSSPRRSRRMPPWVAPAIAGVAAAVIAVVATLIVVHHTTPIASPNPRVTSGESTSDPGGGLVIVPHLTGMTAAQAQSALAGLNLEIKLVPEESTDAMKGLVVSQQPAASSTAKPGGVVTLAIGTGPKVLTVPTSTAPAVQVGTFVMPNLAGLTVTEAVSQLHVLGWTGTAKSVSVRSAETTDPSLVGRIADHPDHPARTYDPRISPPNLSSPPQSPGAGSTASKSVPVRVILYAKKQIVLPVFIPGVSTTDQVLAALSAGGASNVRIITQEPAAPPDVPHTFLSMRPVSGDTVDFDTVITVTVWGNPPPTR